MQAFERAGVSDLTPQKKIEQLSSRKACWFSRKASENSEELRKL